MPIATWLEATLQDIRFGARNLKRTPGFAISAIVSLALGMGATTAIFSVIHGVILDPFPYAHPETLYSFYATVPDKSFFFSPDTPDQFLEIQERTRSFSGLIASTISDVSWTGAGEPQRLRGNFCTVNTFQVMGVKPLLGRYLLPDDGKPDAAPAVVLGYKFWMRQFGADPTVIGQKLRLNDRVRTVVGVMPKRFMWRGADVYLPVVFQKGHFAEDVHFIFVMGRLKPGATLSQAETELHPVLQDLMQRETGQSEPKLRVILRDFYNTFPSGITHSLWILFAAVGVLLLIACANVSSLLLARAAARGREMAVRLSLGAGRGRIIRQLLTESAMIGLTAGVCGVLLAIASLHSILAIVPPDTIPDEAEVSLNVAVLLFTLAISLVTAFLFGLAPSLQAGRADVTSALKASGRGITGAFRETKIRNAFVVAQVALAVILLVSASLVIRTLLHLERVRVGVQPERVLTMTIPLSNRRYPTREARNNFYLELLERARQIPGLTQIAFNQSLHPFVYFGTSARVPGSIVQAKTQVIVSEISAQYPELVNTPLLQGRLLTSGDVRLQRHLAVVNHRFASFFFKDRAALGQSVQLAELHPPPDQHKDEAFEIVGVVGDLPNIGLRRETLPEVYIPFTISGYDQLSTTLLATGALSPHSLIRPLTAQIHGMDPEQPVTQVQTFREWLDLRGYAEPRFSVFLFSVFAALGLLLAALGIYAVVNYSVLRQTQEIGVRMALGAQRGRIVGMIAGSGARLLGAGIVVGLIGSFSLTHFLRSMIWGVSPFDALSLAAAVAILFAIGLAACIRPAWRAARIDPTTALRYE